MMFKANKNYTKKKILEPLKRFYLKIYYIVIETVLLRNHYIDRFRQ